MSNAYYTYRIRLANYGAVKVEKRDLNNQSLGDPEGKFGYANELRQTIDKLVIEAQADALTDDEPVKALGEALFDALFDDVLRQDFVGFYQQVVATEDRILRIELDIDEASMPDVAALPWEFMRVPSKANLGVLWLGTTPKVVFSRRRAQWFPAKPIQLAPNEKLRIALAVAAPSDLGPVLYDKVEASLKTLAAEQSDKFELLPVLLKANAETVDSLLAKKPHIFHFIGHGRFNTENHTPKAEIAFVDDIMGESDWVDSEFFAGLFNTFRPGVVLLHACEGGTLSASQAFVGVASRVVQQNIPVVVAMQYEVTNNTALRFALKFYQQLAAGDPVDMAAQYGRRAVALNTQYKRRDFATPVLFMRVADGHLFARSSKMAVPAIAAAPVVNSAAYVPLTAEAASLPKLIADKFDLQGIRALCGAVGVDIEDLGSSGRAGKAQDLFGKAERTYRLDALVKAMAASIPDLLPEIKANLHVFIERLKPRELTSMCQELGLDCAALNLDSPGLLGYEANKYIRTERAQALQDYMVANGRYPELVQALKKYLPTTEFTIFET